MATEIPAKINELSLIADEIKRHNLELKNLRKRKTELETEIREYLIAKKEPGVRSGNTVIKLATKKKRPAKSAEDKIDDSSNTLQKYGMKNSRAVAEEVINSLKGETEEVEILKIEKLGKTGKKKERK